MTDQLSLPASIELNRDDVERALLEFSKHEPAVAQLLEPLRGAAAERAADALNGALALDIFDVLAQGWIQVPAMRRAVEMSAMMRGPPTLVHIDRHTVASNSLLVLDISVPDLALPPMELTLDIVADVHDATLTACNGSIDLVALGEASLTARISYRGVVLKEQASAISRSSRDALEMQARTARPASVDIPL